MSAETAANRKLYLSLRWKLLAGFTLIFSVVFTGAFFWFLNFATDQALNRVKADLLDTLKGAAAGVDGDELLALSREGQPNAPGAAWLAAANADDAHAASLTDQAQKAFGQPTQAGFSDDPRYFRQLEWLQKVHNIDPRAWPYTYVRGTNPNEVIFITDLWVRYNPSKAAPFDWPYVSKTGASYRGLEGLSQKDNLNPYQDQFGTWISAYMPVKNALGENVGAIGVDFEANYVDEVRQNTQKNLLAAFVIAYVILFVLVYLASSALTGPIIRLTRATELIAEGNYDQDLSQLDQGLLSRVNPRDEIGTLADVFNIMVGKVHQREQTLIKQVEELRIEIDDSKRKTQVSEIVDSEFFQELQAKSRAMRQRRLAEETPESAPASNSAPPKETKRSD
jgi:HAMP domain-containing protein